MIQSSVQPRKRNHIQIPKRHEEYEHCLVGAIHSMVEHKSLPCRTLTPTKVSQVLPLLLRVAGRVLLFAALLLWRVDYLPGLDPSIVISQAPSSFECSYRQIVQLVLIVTPNRVVEAVIVTDESHCFICVIESNFHYSC